MIDKYFGFKTINNEQSVVDSIIEHSRIDEEELLLLHEMILNLCNGNLVEVEDLSFKISKIRVDSNQTFEFIEEQIIQSHFDFQKQYDFLRIYQRIESISSSILKCSDHILLLNRINGKLPMQCHGLIKELIENLIYTHNLFKEALLKYESSKQDVIPIIHNIIEKQAKINDIYFTSIENLYELANNQKLLMGHFRAIENIFISCEKIGNTIEKASTSLEWLLIN
jgi:uncharacterized protein Yka (UPF0111/DUF47 family)